MDNKSCPFCGAGGWITKGESRVYDCSTIVEPHRAGQSAACVAKERDILRQRIDAAIKALEDITRHDVDVDDQFGVLSEYNERGHWVEWDDLEDVVEILRGNSSKNSESSEG